MLQDLLSKFSSPAEKQGYLLQLTAAHPYFAPAQFCLLQTMQPGEVAYGHRAAIAHLLYNNAHWLQFQLAQTAKPQTAIVPSPITEDTAPVDFEAETTEAPAAEAHTEAAPVLLDPTVEAPTAVETEPVHTEIDNTALTEETVSPFAEEAILNDDDTVAAENPANESNEPAEELASAQLEEIPVHPPAPLPAPEKEEMLFEPLFAVDYFASQGIKLSEEVQNSDKLGKQLKSFTEWLKSMKKTYHPDPSNNELANEEDVQTIAEKSNTEDDVVTEAMAEVFALQGRKQKAAAIYRKLSLLNPHKSAYFAAKIENLK